eukprot:11430600-Ditylum_brightwellii.AAC.1
MSEKGDVESKDEKNGRSELKALVVNQMEDYMNPVGHQAQLENGVKAFLADSLLHFYKESINLLSNQPGGKFKHDKCWKINLPVSMKLQEKRHVLVIKLVGMANRGV